MAQAAESQIISVEGSTLKSAQIDLVVVLLLINSLSNTNLDYAQDALSKRLAHKIVYEVKGMQFDQFKYVLEESNPVLSKLSFPNHPLIWLQLVMVLKQQLEQKQEASQKLGLPDYKPFFALFPVMQISCMAVAELREVFPKLPSICLEVLSTELESLCKLLRIELDQDLLEATFSKLQQADWLKLVGDTVVFTPLIKRVLAKSAADSYLELEVVRKNKNISILELSLVTAAYNVTIIRLLATSSQKIT